MSERLPDVVETFAARVMLTWHRATATKPLVFGYTNLPDQVIPKGTTGWAVAIGERRWTFVPDEEGDWPTSCSVGGDSLDISGEFRQATYALPDYYWERFASEGNET